MMDDDAMAIPCPLCGVIVRPDPQVPHHYSVSLRQVVRQAMRRHLISRHSDLSSREASLILDRVCDEVLARAKT